MPININITDSEEQVPQEPEGVKIEIVEKDNIEGKLNLRSSINGDLMIMDHKDIDIVVKPGDKKIIAFAKEKNHNISFSHLCCTDKGCVFNIRKEC